MAFNPRHFDCIRVAERDITSCGRNSYILQCWLAKSNGVNVQGQHSYKRRPGWPQEYMVLGGTPTSGRGGRKRLCNWFFWFKGDAIYVALMPNALEKRLKDPVLEHFHGSPKAGHPGIIKICESVGRYCWWPNIKQGNCDYVLSCDTCQ